MSAFSRVTPPSGLNALADALNVPGMSRRLASFCDPDGESRIVAARLVDHSIGKRAVIAYTSVTRIGERSELIGKLYAEPARAAMAHGVLEQLDALARTGRECAVPRPIAHLAALGLSVYRSSSGRWLDQLEGRDRVRGATAAARWLAALHGSRIDLDRRLDIDLEARNVALWAQEVGRSHPPAASLIVRLLRRLTLLRDGIEVAIGVPIHKDLHYRHVLYEQDRGVAIDLDEARTGDPAFDVAHFAANLRLLRIREGPSSDGAAGLEPAFLDAYSAQTGYRADSRHDFFHVYTCLKIARQLVRGRGPAPVPVGAELIRQLEGILAEGLRCLPV